MACARQGGLCYERWPVLQKWHVLLKSGLCYERWPMLQKVPCATKSGMCFENWHVPGKLPWDPRGCGCTGFAVACAIKSCPCYKK